MLVEALLLLYVGWVRFDLAAHVQALYTFSFLTLLYFAAFSIISARERSLFWATRPGKALTAALLADVVVGTLLTRVGLEGLEPLPWSQTLAVFGYALLACLGINDLLKVALIKWRMPMVARGARDIG